MFFFLFQYYYMEAAVLLSIFGMGYLFNNNDQSDPSDYDDTNNIYEIDNLNTMKEIDEINASNLIKSITKNNIIKEVKPDLSDNTIIEGFDNNFSDNNSSDNNLLDNIIIKGGKEYINTVNGQLIEKSKYLQNNNGYFSNSPDYDKSNIDFNNENNILNYLDGGSSSELWKSKSENYNPSQLFDLYPEDIISMNYIDFVDRDRFNTSKYHNDQLPNTNMLESKIHVNDPINVEIGRSIKERSNIDNIRTSDNKHISYELPITLGKSINDMRGLQAPVNKYDPDSHFELDEGLWGTAKFNVNKESEKPEYIIKNTNRQDCNKTYTGPSTTSNLHQRSRGDYFESFKQQLVPDTERNLTGVSSGDIDYDKLGYSIYPNEREVTENRTYEGNIKGYNNHTIGVQDNIKSTVKQTTIDDNYNGIVSNTTIKDTNRLQDDIRVNKKSTIIENRRDGNLSGNIKFTVGQQDDILPTIKEVTLYSKLLNLKSQNDSSINRDNYLNMNTNPTRELISQGREPTQNSVKFSNGSDTVNLDIKKIESDYMTHAIKGADKVYQIPNGKSGCSTGCNDTDSTCNIGCKLTKNKLGLDDIDLMIDRINPEILNPFKNNPYTKSLTSVF